MSSQCHVHNKHELTMSCSQSVDPLTLTSIELISML